MMAYPTGAITPHFNWEEAKCPDGCEMPEAYYPNVIAMAHVAEAVRSSLGTAMDVDSWFRCWAHHVAIYAAMTPPLTPPLDSKHLTALAIDFKVPGMVPLIVFHQCVPLLNQGIVGGLENAPAHTHIDAGPMRPPFVGVSG